MREATRYTDTQTHRYDTHTCLRSARLTAAPSRLRSTCTRALRALRAASAAVSSTSDVFPEPVPVLVPVPVPVPELVPRLLARVLELVLLVPHVPISP